MGQIEVCLVQNNFNSGGNTMKQLSLSCEQQCLTKHTIRIDQNQNTLTVLLTFGLDSPLVRFKGMKKPIKIQEESNYKTQNLFGIEKEKTVRSFLTKGKTIYHKCNAAANFPPKLCLLSFFLHAGGASMLFPDDALGDVAEYLDNEPEE